MQRPSIRIVTPLICLVGMLALIYLLFGSMDLAKGNWSVLIFAVPCFFGPSLILACFGYQRTKSRALPIILLVSAILSTALWIQITISFLNNANPSGHIDGQAGMAVAIYGIAQWFIVILATLVFFLLRKRNRAGLSSNSEENDTVT